MKEIFKRLTPSEAASKAGFPVGAFIKKTKDELGIGKVRLEFTRGVRASAEHDGTTCVISLPTKASIVKKIGLDNAATIAKQRASILEEICHCREHETLHSKEVVACTIRGIKKHLTKGEQKIPYIRLKIAGLRSARKQGK